MKEFLNQIIPVLTTTFIAILVAFIIYIGQAVVKLVPVVVDYVVKRIGLTNYQKTKAVAVDIFNKIQEDGRLGILVESKIDTFENLIKIKIPGITDLDINLLRQAISGEANKDKPIIQKAIENPVTSSK